ncbi:tripartite tricarboxylate transporter substrate binding protein [Pusillimonas sp. ANT_WB101]|uniref:Bug family tripartite tricarboxylate transporter substrate binding protein n=1 Tax=Pusillimonas sp. ANT_WB101 TaxID=2597356 RepID=UPI0011EDE9EF|nr:tripartite tricarboxylate transporter substrate binding protein [Pusillimonas sp. ANT_WB101]KAA0890723.1 tripartite tricarboxylate transporter substrate binding protein [Pusillimonas sp. ANT_WB101]
MATSSSGSTKTLSRLPRLAKQLTAVAALCASTASFAATWPDHPITLMMGFSAGSGVDVIARSIQEPLQEALGVPVVIDYRPGAGGNLASAAVARAAPDGYTLLLGTAATHGINPAIYKDLPFDVEDDFTPIAPLVDVSNVLTINPKVIDVNTVGEFIAEVKANPDKYYFASTGIGTGTQLAFEEFNARAGLKMVHVPYKGGPEALQSVVKGETCCIFNQVQTVLGQHKAGTVRLLGVSTAKRIDVVKEVPTIAEQAIDGFDSYIWFGLFGPKGMSPELVTKINAAATQALKNPDVATRLVSTGNTVHVSSPDAFRDLVHKNRSKWAGVVEAAGLTPQ